MDNAKATAAADQGPSSSSVYPRPAKVWDPLQGKWLENEELSSSVSSEARKWNPSKGSAAGISTVRVPQNIPEIETEAQAAKVLLSLRHGTSPSLPANMVMGLENFIGSKGSSTRAAEGARATITPENT